MFPEFLPSCTAGEKNDEIFMKISAKRPCGAKNKKKCDRDFPTMNNITIYTRNYLGDILLDLMRIAMDGDQQEFDNDKFGENVAAEIWH